MHKGGSNMITNIIKVYDAVDLTNSSDKYAHKACKRKFLRESYLKSQKTPRTSCEIPQQNELGTEIQNQTVVNPRRSNRKSITYSSSNVERKCIKCNENKCHKGTLMPLYNITLKQVDSQIYNVEEKLIEFAHLHINNNNLKYIEAANKILLTNTSKSFFAADVSYHKCCLYNFCSPWWASNKYINNESEQNKFNDALLFELLEQLIINKHDICTTSQLCSFYHNMTNTKIRGIDVKKNYKKNSKRS